MKRATSFLLSAILAFCLCACGETAPVTTEVLTESTPSTQPATSEETMADENGPMEVSFQLQQPGIPTMVKVTPHFLAEEEVKNAACVLFGDAEYYEARSPFHMTRSRDEIQERLDRWSQYTNADALRELYGEEDDRRIEKINSFIEKQSALLATAPQEDPRIPCKWQFQKDSVYYLHPGETPDTSEDNDTIKAEVQVGGVPYFFDASKRDKADFRINNISAFLNSADSPSHMDDRIFTAQLCRTEKPDEKRLLELQQKAETILQELDVGQWQIDECFVEEQFFGETPEYIVKIRAVPVWEGMPVIRQPQLTALGNGERDYLTDVRFEFSANGDLISFWLFSPMDTEAVIDERVMNADELMAAAEKIFASRDASFYDEKGISFFAQETLGCTVTVTEIRWELNRVKFPDSQEVVYIPNAQFWGTVTIYGTESGKIYDSQERRLLAVNTLKEE